MAYVPKTFVDRSVEFPNRRKLTAVSGLADTFYVARAEGTVFAEGTKPDAANLNAEFRKIKDETDAINKNLINVSPKGEIETIQTSTFIVGKTYTALTDGEYEFLSSFTSIGYVVLSHSNGFTYQINNNNENGRYIFKHIPVNKNDTITVTSIKNIGSDHHVKFIPNK